MTQDERDALIESVKRGATEVKIPLRFPIEHLAKPLGALTLKRPTVGDLIDADGHGRGNAQTELNLLARISGLGPDAIRSLDLSDYDVVTDVLLAFKS